MAGSLTFSPPGGGGGLGGQAQPVGVYFFDPNSGYSLIPNVQVTDIQFREGNQPSSARFVYILDDRAAAQGFPSQFEQLWPLNSPDPNNIGQYIVGPGNRIAVLMSFGDGSWQVLFDGFARMPQVDVSGDQQVVTFSAVGVEIRAWDIIIKGAIQRNGDPKSIQAIDGSQDVETTLPTRFNPGDARHPTGQPNCSPDNYDTGQDDQSTSYAVFVDYRIDRTDPTKAPRLWVLSDAVRYLLSVYNPPNDPQEPWAQQDLEDIEQDPLNQSSADSTYFQFVQNPDFTDLTNLLDNRAPQQGSQYFDPNDPGTYTSNPIIVRDFDCTNMAWPDAVERLLGYYGFGFSWALGQDGNGFPTHNIYIYRKDAGNANAPKFAFMQEGGTLDPTQSNVEQMSASFDYHGIANEFIVETHPNRYEISVILAPLFTPTAGDETASGRTKFDRTGLDTADDATRRAYRWYGVDECGDGFWSFAQKQMVNNTAFDFSKVFPAEQDENGNSIPQYVTRFRPGRRDCLSDDGNGDVYQSQLALSRDYQGDCPTLWDGQTGTWQPINSDWELLEDRLGIEFTADNPEAIHAGDWDQAARGGNTVQNSGKVLKGITSIANPGNNNQTNTQFFLRLTTVIDSDLGIEATAQYRPASPIGNTIQRRLDAKDHFRLDTVHQSSAFFQQEQQANPNLQANKAGNLVPRDDTQPATDFANQMRTAHEFPALPMAITIPGISLAYGIGDRISYIAGRGVSLQVNTGTQQGEGASYPFVCGLSFTFSGDAQNTHLQLSDRRMEPQPIEHRRGR